MSLISLIRSCSGQKMEGAQCVNPLLLPQWDQEVSRLPDAGIFHSAGWTRVLAETYGFDPCFFVERQAGRLATVIPALECDSSIRGRRGVSLPFTDRCQILGPAEARQNFFDSLSSDPAGTGAKVSPLWSLIQQVAQERKWKFFETRDGHPVCPGEPPSNCYVEHVLDLAGGEKKLLAAQTSANRRAIQKAQRSGLKIEVHSSLEATREYYRLHELTRQGHGVPPQPWSFFENIWRYLLDSGSGFIVLGRLGHRAVAGAVFFHFARSAVFKFGASDPLFLSCRGNNLVLWEAIRRFASDGFSHLNFGRTSSLNDGLRRFKQAWGAQERPVEYSRFSFGDSRVWPCRGETRGLAPIFRLMPRWMLRGLGQALYRHMA